uniref:Uncharacterized protein n=1 Tax=Anguilla anguilla TaxID=7936 RepID=A0A0E9RMK5_ANGAN
MTSYTPFAFSHPHYTRSFASVHYHHCTNKTAHTVK